MQDVSRAATLVLVSFFACSFCQAETLKVVGETSYVVSKVNYDVLISALQLGGDTILSGSEAGIFARYDSGQPWQKLMGCLPSSNITWSDACYKRKRWERLFSPQKMWRIPVTNDIVVYDNYCGCLSTLQIRGRDGNYAQLWREGQDKDYFNTISIQDNLILCAIRRYDNDTVVILEQTDKTGYERIFVYPLMLGRRLDSVGLGSGSLFCFPALSPADSTLWLAVMGYDYMYLTDMEGRLLDSLAISASDYRLPPPPISRIKSQAIWADWMSKWTPITSFWYVQPHYFFLQYRIGWEDHGDEKIPLYSTLVWDTDRKPTELAVDKHWQLAGVQPDGRLIFGRFVIEDDQRRIELYMARIEP